MKTVLFYNTTAGNAPLVAETVRELSREAICRVVPFDRHSNRHEAIRAAIGWKGTRWVVAGGDGTIHQVVDVLGERAAEIELGIVPCGTGNDFARSLDARLEDLRSLCLDPEFGTAALVDLMRLTDLTSGRSFRCLNAATGGIGGEMAERIGSADKRTWGPFAYWASAIGALTEMREFLIELGGSDSQGRAFEPESIPLYGLVASNGRFIGGGFPIAPSASLDDGRLDITLIPVLPVLELVAAGIAAATGNIEHSSAIIRRRVRELTIASRPPLPLSVDGEPHVSSAWRLSVEPKALRLVLPRTAPGLGGSSSLLPPPSVDPSRASEFGSDRDRETGDGR